jgi:hypothetical protein
MVLYINRIIFVEWCVKLYQGIWMIGFAKKKAPPRFELGDKGVADLCLTTWLRRPDIKKLMVSG